MGTDQATAEYVDTTDPHGATLHIGYTDASTYDGTVPVIALAIESQVSCNEDDNIIYIRVEDIEDVIGKIRAAAKAGDGSC